MIEYIPPGSDGRTYNGKDSLSSARGFEIAFTNELGQTVEFMEEYELMIAIFFD